MDHIPSFRIFLSYIVSIYSAKFVSSTVVGMLGFSLNKYSIQGYKLKYPLIRLRSRWRLMYRSFISVQSAVLLILCASIIDWFLTASTPVLAVFLIHYVWLFQKFLRELHYGYCSPDTIFIYKSLFIYLCRHFCKRQYWYQTINLPSSGPPSFFSLCDHLMVRLIVLIFAKQDLLLFSWTT